MMTRRDLLGRIVALSSWAVLAPVAPRAAAATDQSDAGQPFSQAWLREEARRLSLQPFQEPVENLPSWVTSLDWDQYQSIRFLPERSLWAGGDLPFQARMFHMGLYFKHPVTLYEVVDGIARQVAYSHELFDFGKKVKVPEKMEDIGFAGFRVCTKPEFDADMFSFLGASYFRAVGASKQYGMSARGLAVDTGFSRPEEFPAFRRFWLERPAPDADRVAIHALLDSPSVSGAYTFWVAPGETTIMEIDAHLFPRAKIERIGIAPLTGMYQCGENDRRVSDDFRPEIHDADGLSMHTGSGEWIWRPLVNSPVLRVNSFVDRNPKGFGLLQRDRDFDHYLDDGVFYDQRPSVWVEPIGDWGQGSVQLVEIPTPDETFDNIVAFWNPEESFAPGQERSFRYRLHWGAEPPARSPSAEVIATRLGAAGMPGQKDRAAGRKFVIDFRGGRLDELPVDAELIPVVNASRGVVTDATCHRIKKSDVWRCHFDLASDGTEPIDLRCYLKDERGALSETWLYQWTPPGV